MAKVRSGSPLDRPGLDFLTSLAHSALFCAGSWDKNPFLEPWVIFRVWRATNYCRVENWERRVKKQTLKKHEWSWKQAQLRRIRNRFEKWLVASLSNRLPGRSIHKCGASKSVARRFWTTVASSSISWSWGSKIVKGSVGWSAKKNKDEVNILTAKLKFTILLVKKNKATLKVWLIFFFKVIMIEPYLTQTL